MAWADVFGEAWFWVAAAILWARAALSVYGAPRPLIGEARRGTFEGRRDGVGAASFALSLVRWRLGPGQPLPTGLLPLRWPLLGAAAAYCASDAVFGGRSTLALLTALGPILAATLALEPRLIAAVDAARGADGESEEAAETKLAGFADALEQIWRARMAATVGAILLTLVAAIVTRP